MTERKHSPEHLKLESVLKVEEDTPPELVEALRKYFEPFAEPVIEEGRPVCLNCGEPIDSFKQALGVGVAWRWGMVHGECRCSGCGWPGRGMHYIKDASGAELMSARNLFLAYHPDLVTARDEGGKVELS